ncbi:MAG TPA: PQQ-binding-like beta-propeller repeat protein, partial [Pirellulales bacterium]
MRTGPLSIIAFCSVLVTAAAFRAVLSEEAALAEEPMHVEAAVHAEEEWSRFRGPNGQGQSEATTIPTEWTEADYNWKIELPGIGHSSPVVWGDKVFVTSADPETAMQHVLCIDAATGHKLWQRDFPSATYHVHQQNNFASSTPALDDKRIYFAFASVDEFALLALTHNGEDVWRINLGTFKTEHGFGTSPIVVGDQVIIT